LILDLTQLDKMHPLLPLPTVADYALKGALGLERRGHVPGARLIVSLDGEIVEAKIIWTAALPGNSVQLDRHRITEDAAEAVALALVYEANGWVVRRRMQRGEFADWLLIDRNMRLVALEVSGIDDQDRNGRRLQEKIEQVRHNSLEQKAACVVELAPPQSTLAKVR
jgi:hypothetical protein